MVEIGRPKREESHDYANSYIERVEGDDLLKSLERIHNQTWKVLGDLSISYDHRYAPGKWSIKEVVQHLIDTERILSFRALCFARGEQQELPGFEENDYAPASRCDAREFHDIMRDFDAVRNATRELYISFDEEMLSGSGIANGQRISARGLGWMLAGHEQHHLGVIQERYL